jgi:hypothetical protein
MKVPTMVLGLEVTISLLDAIMSAVLVLGYEVALAGLIIMMFRLLRRGDRQDRRYNRVEQRIQDLEFAADSQNMLNRGPSIPRMPRMPLGWRRRQQESPNRSDSYGDLSYGSGDDSYPPTPQQQHVERQIQRLSQGPQGPQGQQAQQRGAPAPVRRTAPPVSPENSDGRWEYLPDDSLGGAERQRRVNQPLTHWTQ